MKKFFRFLSISAVLLLAANDVQSQCAPNFTFTVGSGGVVNFASTSVGTNSLTMYYWSFGNSTYTNGINQQTGSATYTTNGYYTVTLWITDTLTSGPCNGFFTDTILVNTAGCNDNLVISHVPQANGLVNFSSSLSTPQGMTSFTYNFGDGNSSSSSSSHTYLLAGPYTVTLTANYGVCTYTATKNISVTIANCNINASFTYSLSSNGVVYFFNNSTGTSSTTTYYWYFGDGSNAFGPVVTHTYNMNSQYGVILMVNDSLNTFGCKDTTIHFLNITTAPCTNNTSFNMAKDSVMALTWNAMPNYPGNVTAVSWNWGDGSSSNGFYPSHTYSAAGYYSICVSTTLSCGSPTTVCWAGNIYRPASGSSENGSMVTVNVLNPNTAVGIKQVANVNQHINYYPSPVADILTIEAPNAEGALSLRILDAVGKVIRSEKLSVSDSGKAQIIVSELPSGLYYLQIESIGSIYNAKLIKQ